jgi:hypothetical protein
MHFWKSWVRTPTKNPLTKMPRDRRRKKLAKMPRAKLRSEREEKIARANVAPNADGSTK